MVSVELPTSRWNGAGDRRVLLIHGVASNRGTWWNVAERLADLGCTVIAPDLRGHGDAPTTARYRFDDFAADLASIGSRWDLVIGHSLGGPIACVLAQRTPDIDALLLLDPVFVINESDFETVAADQISEADAHANPVLLARANPTWHPLDAFHKARAARSISPYTVERVMRDNAPWDHRTLLTGLERTVHILAADPAVFTMCPASVCEPLSETENLVSFEIVNGTGHSIHRDDPNAVVDSARKVLGLE